MAIFLIISLHCMERIVKSIPSNYMHKVLISILLIIELLAIILVSDLEQGINLVSVLLLNASLFAEKKKWKRKKEKFSLVMARHAFLWGP